MDRSSLDDLRACVLLDGLQDPRKGARYMIGVDLGSRPWPLSATVSAMAPT